MRQANGRKRQDDKARLEAGENVQPALTNSAVSNAHDPMPEGNWKEAVDKINQQAEEAKNRAVPYYAREVELFRREFERRAAAMPFVRFVANGEPLPTEIGNVDKLQAIDGSGTWYMFPTSENLRLSHGDDFEDPTQGQEAQGGPLHGITGRGEKYAGGNIETDMVADVAKDPQGEGKGSQTGGTGVQRARLGDASAIESAVEDTETGNAPDQFRNQANEGNGHLRPLAPGTVIRQTGKVNREPGVIVRTTDVSKLHGKGGMFEVQKDREAPKAPSAQINRTDHKARKGDEKPKPTVVDTSFADAMKEGNKTATDAAAAGAVTAGNSAADIEQASAGIVGGFDGRQSEDASEGTSRDIRNPTTADLDPRNDPYRTDWSKKDQQEIYDFLDDHGIRYSTGATRTDLEVLAQKTEAEAGKQLAKQKSDEATPQTSGGVLVGGANAKAKGGKSQAKVIADREEKVEKKAEQRESRSGGVKITSKSGNGKKTGAKKPSTSKPANKPEAADHDAQKAAEPGVIKEGGEETKPEEKSGSES